MLRYSGKIEGPAEGANSLILSNDLDIKPGIILA